MIIKPLGHHRARLVEQLGRAEWIYAGIPERGLVQLPFGVVDVWL